jgi:hypothetical protein
MSQQAIFTFSVADGEKKSLQLIRELKEECRRTGRSFSFICVEALKQYKEAKDESRRA